MTDDHTQNPDGSLTDGVTPVPPRTPDTRMIIVVLVSGTIAVSVSTILLYPHLSRFSGLTVNPSNAPVPSPRITTSLLPTPPPLPTPTPIVLKHGIETYAVSQGAHNGPEITRVTFDPLDVTKDQMLTVTVTVSDIPVTDTVTATLEMDRTHMTFPLQRMSRDDTKSLWQGTVTPTDTLWYRYILTVSATNSQGTSKAIVAPRS